MAPKSIHALAMERLDEERELWEAIDWVLELQSMRLAPVSRLPMSLLLGDLIGDEAQKHVAQRISTLPMRLGGLGLRYGSRTSHAAFWTFWEDSLQMIAQRLPTLAAKVLAIFPTIRRRSVAERWVLGRRGFPLENVAARICRVADGRVRMNVFVRDLDLPVINNLDERRLEVVV